MLLWWLQDPPTFDFWNQSRSLPACVLFLMHAGANNSNRPVPCFAKQLKLILRSLTSSFQLGCSSSHPTFWREHDPKLGNRHWSWLYREQVLSLHKCLQAPLGRKKLEHKLTMNEISSLSVQPHKPGCITRRFTDQLMQFRISSSLQACWGGNKWLKGRSWMTYSA